MLKGYLVLVMFSVKQQQQKVLETEQRDIFLLNFYFNNQFKYKKYLLYKTRFQEKKTIYKLFPIVYSQERTHSNILKTGFFIVFFSL